MLARRVKVINQRQWKHREANFHGIASPRSLTVFRDISIISDLRVATYVENPLTWHPLQNLGRVKHSDIETLDCTRSPSQMLRNRAPHENNRKSREKPILWSFLAFTRHFYENFFLVLLKTRRIFVWFHFASIFSIFVRKNIFRCFKEQETWTFACGSLQVRFWRLRSAKFCWNSIAAERNQEWKLNSTENSWVIICDRPQCYRFVIFVLLSTRTASETVHHVFSIVFCEFIPSREPRNGWML